MCLIVEDRYCSNAPIEEQLKHHFCLEYRGYPNYLNYNSLIFNLPYCTFFCRYHLWVSISDGTSGEQIPTN